MAENSNIEWTHHTFNPWEGCQKVGPGCDNCYAEARDNRFTGGAHWGPGAPRRRTSAANWRKPLAWDRAASLAGEQHRVFCASLADWADNAVDPAWRADLWALIRATPHLVWMLLTKRAGNIAGMVPEDWGDGYPNVWIGCTVVNQEEADRDIPKLLAVPAAARFLSMEPLLGPVDLRQWLFDYGCGCGWGGDSPLDYCRNCGWRGNAPGAHCPGDCPDCGEAVDDYQACPECDGHDGDGLSFGPNHLSRLALVIVGGESGKRARPMHPDWARALRDQCQAAGVAFFFKQWGEWAPEELVGLDEPILRECRGRNDHRIHYLADATLLRVGKRAAGRLLDGREWSQMPGVRYG